MGRLSEARWYGGLTHWKGEVGKVQIESQVRSAADGRQPLRLPEPVLHLAQAEYDRQLGGQPYERMQERGGLGVLEIVALMADRIEYLEREIERPKAAVAEYARELETQPGMIPKDFVIERLQRIVR